MTITETPTDTQTPTPTVTVTLTITPTVTATAQLPTGETWLYYYYSGTTRIAMRQMSQYGDNVMFLLTDHLGSSSIVTDAQGAKIGEVRYKAWGETRYDSGNVPTKQRFTGQREESELGLIYYGARWYDPSIGRFNQADTIIPQPGNPLAWDRYSYTLNNPVRYNDPSGHDPRQIFAGDGDGTYTSFIKKNQPINIKKDNKLVEPGTFFSQEIEGYTGLCGLASSTEVVQTQNPNISLNSELELAQENGLVFNYPRYDQLEQLIEMHDGWQAYSTWGEGGVADLQEILSIGQYPIVRVFINGGNGDLEASDTAVEHWVVVTAIMNDGDNVQIYNPYDNQLENYTSEKFVNNWNKSIGGRKIPLMVVAIPPTEYFSGIYGGRQ